MTAETREALEALVLYERKRHPPRMGGDRYPPSLREIMTAAEAVLAKRSQAELMHESHGGNCVGPDCAQCLQKETP